MNVYKVGKIPIYDCFPETENAKISQSGWKVFRVSEIFPTHPETFQSVRKLIRVSGNFLECPKTFHCPKKIQGDFLVLKL